MWMFSCYAKLVWKYSFNVCDQDIDTDDLGNYCHFQANVTITKPINQTQHNVTARSTSRPFIVNMQTQTLQAEVKVVFVDRRGAPGKEMLVFRWESR